MKKKSLLLISLLVISAISFAVIKNPRISEITVFYDGHIHNGEETIRAPQHSGGTDRYGCHNASVPYHCH